MICVVAIWGSS